MTRPRVPAPTRRQPRSIGARCAGFVAVAALVALAACSPAPSPAPTAAPASPTPTAVAPTPGAPTASPDPGSPSPSPTDTGPVAVACETADLKVSHGLVEGTAGSRNTEVLLVAAVACAIPAGPAFELRDANGGPVAAGTVDAPGTLTLFPGQVYVSEARFANWCGGEPAFPLELRLRVIVDTVAVTGGSFPDEGDLPPCTTTGAPILTGTAWAPAP